MYSNKAEILKYLDSFNLSGTQPTKTEPTSLCIGKTDIPVFANEFWTSKQRQSSSIHEVSYRACFKPELPDFFIRLLTRVDDIVYDPFSGRGTTAVQAALLKRRVAANDINTLSSILLMPRLMVPELEDIEKTLARIPVRKTKEKSPDLSMFFHPDTETEIRAIRRYILGKEKNGTLSPADKWIRMVASGRLTGHSSGFFSVYTLPPNQAASQTSQIKINLKRGQSPEYRDTRALIIRKTKSLLRNLNPEDTQNLRRAAQSAVIFNTDAAKTSKIKDASVRLTVTSPPFLDIVQYAKDNWMRCWFNGIDADRIEKKISTPARLRTWEKKMAAVLRELFRITAPGGWVAFEVGEVRKGSLRLEEQIIPLGTDAGFECCALIINTQKFTKTANIWGIKNNSRGTNSNRIVLFNKTPRR